MLFRVKARTLVQLGAELISSDGIAFYELIKNAFDARSPRVTIDITQRIPYSKYLDIRAQAVGSSDRATKIAHLKNLFEGAVEPHSFESAELLKAVADVEKVDEFLSLLDRANTIVISDSGIGMSERDLEQVFLEVGTPVRLKEQQRASNETPVLGEKGLGRLSSMRLGWHLAVRTTQSDDDKWHILSIDWAKFAEDPDLYIEDVPIPKVMTAPKKHSDKHGTVLTITRLQREWSAEDLRDMALEEFSRLIDPFSGAMRFPLTLRFNGETIAVPSFDHALLNEAHAVVEARFDPGNERGKEPRLRGSVVARRYDNRVLTFDLGLAELMTIVSGTEEDLRFLGPFHVIFYWYNRQALTAIEGIGDKKRVLKVMRDWANGLMVFRDGFRVNPYGGPDDDWLDLDKKALGSAGYKVNRHQIIGKVDISRRGNPHLTDQTNREGLQHGPAFQCLVRLLQHVMWTQFKQFLDALEKEAAPKLSIGELATRVRDQRREIKSAMRELQEKHPVLRKDSELLVRVDEALTAIANLMKQTQEVADRYENQRSELVHLAGIGLMVEVVAHELNRSTRHALTVLSDLDDAELSSAVESTITSLKAQLKTINTRLRVLDPLTTAGRQRKEEFDLHELVKTVVESRAAEFKRHRIRYEVRTTGHDDGGFHVRMVRGMVVQVLENLISNSVYWLKVAQRMSDEFRAQLEVVLNPRARTLMVTDNGPGVAPEMADRIFEPFFTTKPPGQGKGLGLYIAREIAEYHGATLALSPAHGPHANRLNTFVLSLSRDDAK